MSAPAKPPLNGSVRQTIATLADEERRRAVRERADLITRLRTVNALIAEMETQLAVAGVETVDATTKEEHG